MKRIITSITTTIAIGVAAVVPGAFAADIWVQADYTGTSTGTSTQPYKHIYDVVNVVVSGDVVRVRAGTYNDETVWLRSGVYYKSEVWRGAKLVGRVVPGSGVFNYWGGADPSDNGANIWSSRSAVRDVTIDGFEITYPAGTAADARGISVSWVHNCAFVNNWIHDVPSSGIGTAFCDYITIAGIKINDCAGWTQPLCYSGISMFKTQPRDSNGGFHNKIQKNYLRHNYNGPSGSDGNGIIIDTTRWDKGTLVENNVIWDNGGVGVMLDGAWNCTVRYNTLFMNSWRLLMPEIYAQKVDWDSGQWNTDCYNIQCYGNRLSTQAVKLNPGTGSSSAWGNLRWHATSGSPSGVPLYFHSDGTGADTSGSGDVTANPLFINAQYTDGANFRPQSNSPVRNCLSTNTSDGYDMDWFARTSLYDMGAFEWH